MQPDFNYAHWLAEAVNLNLKRTAIRSAKLILKPVDFDTIVMTGLSGYLFGSVLAYSMRKQIAAIRTHEPKHSTQWFEGHIPYRYIIVDDFVSSGSTIRHILFQMEKYKSTLVGIYCYHHNSVYSEPAGFYGTGSTLYQRLGLT